MKRRCKKSPEPVCVCVCVVCWYTGKALHRDEGAGSREVVTKNSVNPRPGCFLQILQKLTEAVKRMEVGVHDIAGLENMLQDGGDEDGDVDLHGGRGVLKLALGKGGQSSPIFGPIHFTVAACPTWKDANSEEGAVGGGRRKGKASAVKHGSTRNGAAEPEAKRRKANPRARKARCL